MNASKEIDAFVMYMENVKNRSPKTIEAYRSDLHEFCSVIDFRSSVSDVTQEDVESVYIKHLVGAGNSPASRARKLSALRSFFRWAVRNKIVSASPVEDVEMPKVPHKEPKVMSVEEVQDMVLNVKYDDSRECEVEGFRNLAIISLMFATGLRRSEVTEIKLKDVCLEDGSLLVHGKGAKERVVYFNDTARAVLSEYIASHRKSLKPSETSEYLFVSKRAEKLNPATINKIVNKYLKAAGIKEKGYTAHSTRKAFATQVYRNTNDLVATQYLLGHSNPQTTMRYVGASEMLKKKAAMTVSF